MLCVADAGAAAGVAAGAAAEGEGWFDAMAWLGWATLRGARNRVRSLEADAWSWQNVASTAWRWR